MEPQPAPAGERTADARGAHAAKVTMDPATGAGGQMARARKRGALE